MPDEMTDADAAFTFPLKEAQQVDPVTGRQPTDREIAKVLGCGVRRVRNHPSYIDSMHWAREMEKVRPRRRRA
jgi:hypothetical protein